MPVLSKGMQDYCTSRADLISAGLSNAALVLVRRHAGLLHQVGRQIPNFGQPPQPGLHGLQCGTAGHKNFLEGSFMEGSTRWTCSP